MTSDLYELEAASIKIDRYGNIAPFAWLWSLVLTAWILNIPQHCIQYPMAETDIDSALA